ncbi:MAG: HAD-IIB family hydrolase [Bacillota bacterium]|nr:HAD-IIB family hydrolase [Bacillota bacterium]
MQKPIFAVFLDLDGTLMVKNQIPPENRAAISAVRSRGHLVFLNTGRSMACIPPHVMESIEFDGIVAGMGSHITCRDTVLRSVVISLPLLQEVTEYFNLKQYPCIYEGEDRMIYARLTAPSTMPNVFYLGDQDHFADSFGDVRITKLTMTVQLTAEDRAYLSDAFTAYQHETYAEIVLKGCSKADGMQRVLDHLGLDKAYSIAIGDSANDEDMLCAAGISVAMGNATEPVKALCDHLTTDAVEAGVAAALRKLLPA